MTMVVLNRRQRAVLAYKLPDGANIAAGALVFGQYLSDRPFSAWAAALGAVLWALLIAVSVILAGGSET